LSANLVKLIQSGTGIVLSSIFGIGLIKVIALKGGPETLGYFGVFRQFFQLLTVIFTLGNGYAVIEGIPKTQNVRKFIQAVSGYTFWVCAILSTTTLIFSNQISGLLFNNNENLLLIRLLPFMIFAIAYTLLMRSVYAGKGKLIHSGVLWSFSYFFMFLVSLLSTGLDHLYFYGSVISFIIAIFLFKDRTLLIPKLKFERIITFEKTAISTAITGVTGFFSFLVVRAICLNELGPDDGGLLESSWNLINYTVLIFLTSLSTYYLPQISARPNDVEFRKKFFLLINGSSLTALLILCLGKSLIIPLLFSEKFLPASTLLVLMSVGEYIKCITYFFIFSFIGLSKKKAYLILDTIANFAFIVLAMSLPTKSLESFGHIYIIYQTIYLIGALLLNFKFKVIPMHVLLSNLLLGTIIWITYYSIIF